MSVGLLLLLGLGMMGQMSEGRLEQEAAGIATAVEEQTATGEVVQSVPQPFKVPGQAKSREGGSPANAFERADKDGNGRVSFEEFARLIEEEKFDRFDQDGNGALSEKEAKAASAVLTAKVSPGGDTPRKLITIPFSQVDLDGDGHLSREEVITAVKKQPEIQTIFRGIGQASPPGETRPDGVSLDEWNNFETVGGGVPLVRFSF